MLGGLIRPGKKAPVATDWVTAADVVGVGSNVVNGANMEFDLTSLPDLAEPWTLEVRYSHRRTGGTGSVQTWVRSAAMHLADKPNPNSRATEFTSGRVENGNLSDKHRRVYIRPLITQATASVWEEELWIRLDSAGSQSDTEFAVTNIKARLIYTPL